MWQLSPRFMAVQTFYETARKQVLLLRSGLKRSLRSCNDNQLSSPLSITTLSFFDAEKLKAFSSTIARANIWRVSETSEEASSMTPLRSLIFIGAHVYVPTCKNFTHNYHEYGHTRTYAALRFEISTRGVVHSYITFPANGSGRLE